MNKLQNLIISSFIIIYIVGTILFLIDGVSKEEPQRLWSVIPFFFLPYINELTNKK